MWLYIVSIALAIVANVFYYIFQKSTPHQVNPLAALMVTYFTAMVTCMVIFPFYPDREGFLVSLKKVNWASISLGVAVVGLEMGFLLAYRAGWNISTAGVFANVIVALILIPVGIYLFKEHLNLMNAAGILLCILGLMLISKK
ncbi:MAG: EamA family transporter [Clostridia bacterium]|nr:EamA family transporter [Clostridia bacterium]